VLPLGLPESSLPALIGDLAANNQTAIATVPGITPQIIGAGVGGLFEAYSLGFRFVWVAAGCFMVLAAVCKLNLPSCDLVHFYCSNKDAALFSGVSWNSMLTVIRLQVPSFWSTQLRSLTCTSMHLRRRARISSLRLIVSSQFPKNSLEHMHL
jgi:hypothetical protein